MRFRGLRNMQLLWHLFIVANEILGGFIDSNTLYLLVDFPNFAFDIPHLSWC